MRLSVVALMFLGLSSGSNPRDLVSRLGAGKYAQREAASASLEKLGREALPALKAARNARDAEIRNRALHLVDRIESDLMVRPTLVGADFRDVPVGEAIAILGGRAGIPLSFPIDDEAAQARKVTLARPDSMPFWRALDEVARAGNLELAANGFAMGFGPSQNRAPSLSLFPLPPGIEPAASSVSGPFRISLLNMTHNRERTFVAGNGGMIAMPGAMNDPPMAGQSGMASEQFFLNLQLLAEPRMSVTMNGPVQLTEAVDDRGNSLLPANLQGTVFQHNSGYNRFEMVGGAAVQAVIPLKYPEDPGREIKRLRGKIALTVSSRKDDPLTIPLASAKGKTFRTSEVFLTVHETRPEPNSEAVLVDLSIRPVETATDGLLGQEVFQFRVPGNPQSQLEVADAQGKVLGQWHMTSQMQGPDGTRMTLRLMPGDGVPDQLRYYDLARAVTEAEFEFTNVGMP